VAAGVGGVIGGVLLAAKDPRVQQAATSLSATLLGELQGKASGFIGPVLGAIDKVRRAFDDLDPVLNRIFNSSRFVQPLVDGAVQGVKGFLAGLANAVDKADPVINQLGLSLSQLGTAAGDFFTKMAGHADEGAAAIRGLTHRDDRLPRRRRRHHRRCLSEVFGVLDTVTDGVKKVSGGASPAGLDHLLGLLRGRSKTGGKNTDEAALSAEQVLRGARAGQGLGHAPPPAARSATSSLPTRTSRPRRRRSRIAQKAYNDSLDALGPAGGRATQVADGLRRAIDALHGAQVSATDANEAYEASWDSLTASIKANGRSLNIHTVAGRSNRDALEAVAAAARDGYVADVQAGIGIAQATKKHDARITALKEEAHRSGLNKKATNDLIDTYGAIPKKKETNLILSGLNKVAQALEGLYLYQRSLATGRTVGQVAHDIAHEKGLPSGFQGPVKGPDGKFYAQGGQVSGWSPHPRADNIPAMLTANEWVHPVDAVDYYGPQIMGAIQKRQVPREVLAEFATGQLGKMGDLPFFATGGRVAPVDTSTLMRFMVNASGTRVPSKTEVAAKVPIGAGPAGDFVRAQNGKPYIWASAGPKGYDCSGIASAVYNVAHGRNPYNHIFSTSSLPGHWFPKRGIGGPLTVAWSNPGESPASSTTGHMMGMVNGLTFESTGSRGVHLGASTRRLTDFAHIAHYAQGGPVGHIAMANGGVIREPVVGIGASGRTYSFGERGAETVTPGAGGDIHVHLHNAVITSKRQAVDLVVEAYNTAKKERKIR
jgi:hypothetical protein